MNTCTGKPLGWPSLVCRVFSLIAVVLLTAAAPARRSLAEESAAGGEAEESPPPKATADDGSAYPVTAFELEYAAPHSEHPDIAMVSDQVGGLSIVLGIADDGYVAPREGYPSVTIRIGELPTRQKQSFHSSAVNRVCAAVVTWFNGKGYIGVLVRPHQEDVDRATGKDNRVAMNTTLRLVIDTAVVADVRTVAAGDRIRDEDRVNSSAHEQIRKNSPVQPGSLIKKEIFDDYIFRLNRYPSRRVDAAVSSATEQGQVSLDYLVAEPRPVMVFAQVSNTGTKHTNVWRERLGLVDNQLTGHDDVLTFDYITAGFEQSHAIVTSYERPIFGLERLRGRIHGSWSEFDASQVGRAEESFTGEEWSGGTELIWNVMQRRRLFLDLLFGVRSRNITVNNTTAAVEGKEQFLLPHVGLRLEQNTELTSTSGHLNIEGNWASAAGTSPDGIVRLGRLNTDTDWTVLQWNLSHSMFIDPLLDREKWEDPQRSTLAHEVALSFRGQYAYDYRLIPQAEDVMGGLYTVRGYEESVAAGDTTLLGSAEYRLHIPRLLKVEPEARKLLGKPFRLAPQQVGGRPDWDLMFRAFIDAGKTINNRRISIEQDQTLVGTGVGIELQVKRNLNVRCDYGVPLEDLRGTQDTGSGRAHLSITLLW